MSISGFDPGPPTRRLVGNDPYEHADKLVNPLIDARRMRDKLVSLGVNVVCGENLDKRSRERAVGDFASAAHGVDMALVYFAGYGATFG